jgi:hypothetical protein
VNVEPNFLQDLWLAAKQAGPFATTLLLFLLYVVNDERKTLQKRNEELTRDMLRNLNETTNAIRDLASLFRRDPR